MVFFVCLLQGIFDEDNVWDMQEYCQVLLVQVGFGQYEVSVYVCFGWQSVYNLNYWCFGDYLGIGVGVYGKISLGVEEYVLCCWKLKYLQVYLDSVGMLVLFGGDDVIVVECLLFEYMFNLLCLYEGFGLCDFELCIGLLCSVLDVLLVEVVQCGWLDVVEGYVQLIELGCWFINDVVSLFLED